MSPGNQHVQRGMMGEVGFPSWFTLSKLQPLLNTPLIGWRRAVETWYDQSASPADCKMLIDISYSLLPLLSRMLTLPPVPGPHLGRSCHGFADPFGHQAKWNFEGAFAEVVHLVTHRRVIAT